MKEFEMTKLSILFAIPCLAVTLAFVGCAETDATFEPVEVEGALAPADLDADGTEVPEVPAESEAPVPEAEAPEAPAPEAPEAPAPEAAAPEAPAPEAPAPEAPAPEAPAAP